jgi:broad specificity phosphatase PhoE
VGGRRVVSISAGSPAYAKKHPSNSLRVLLVRHGSAEQDSLTGRGIEEARATGKALKQKEIVAVIASPAGRTKQTAALIVQELGRPAVVAEDDAFRVKQGESIEHATVRALGALRALAERYGGGTVVIVTHFDVCAALLRLASGNAEAAPCPRHELGAPSITEITVLPGGLLTLALSSPSSPVAR